MIITIDGPAGTGKSTVTKRVAASLGFSLLDTGALYRAVAYAIVKNNIDINDEAWIEKFLRQTTLTITQDAHYLIGDLDTTPHIRSPKSSETASVISAYSSVRSFLLPIQRSLASQQDTVCEGRDMGTTVFPNADIKFFLTASPEVRAQRRFLELSAKKQATTLAEVRMDLDTRDRRDSTRQLSPLKIPTDAIVIDTGTMTIEQVVSLLIEYVKTRLNFG